MKNRALMFWLAVLCLFSGSMLLLYAGGWLRGGAAVAGTGSEPSGEPAAGQHVVDVPVAAGTEQVPFVLTDQNNKPFDSKQLAGKVWVGSIFFATCPSTCRMQNQQVAKLQHEFKDQGLQFVSITCDPDVDTPEKLWQYARLFNADAEVWHFLTGDIELIRKVGGRRFGITVDQKVHSDRLVLIGRDGAVVGTYRSLLPDQVVKLRNKLGELLSDEAVAKSVPE